MDNNNQLPPAPMAEELRGNPVAFSTNGNLFWYGDPTEKRGVNCDLYTHSQPAVPHGLVPISDYQDAVLALNQIYGCAQHCDCNAFELASEWCNKTHGGEIPLTAVHSAPVAPAIDVDTLAQYIRKIDGNNDMGAGALAESICNWIEEQQ